MVLIFGWYFKHLGLNYTERLNTHKEEQVHIYIYGTMVIAFKIFMYSFADKKVFLKCGRNKIVETYSRVTEKSPVIILKVETVNLVYGRTTHLFLKCFVILLFTPKIIIL